MTEAKTPAKRPTKAAPAEKAPAPAAAAAMPFDMPKFEFPKFEMPKFDAVKGVEMPTMFREMAEKGLDQAKVTYEKMKTSAEDATDVIEDTYETARAGMSEYNLKALDAVKENTDAVFAFAKDMASVNSLAKAIELQTAFARKSFDAMSAQAKELTEVAQKVANDTAQPMKVAVEKAFKDLKAA